MRHRYEYVLDAPRYVLEQPRDARGVPQYAQVRSRMRWGEEAGSWVPVPWRFDFPFAVYLVAEVDYTLILIHFYTGV